MQILLIMYIVYNVYVIYKICDIYVMYYIIHRIIYNVYHICVIYKIYDIYVWYYVYIIHTDAPWCDVGRWRYVPSWCALSASPRYCCSMCMPGLSLRHPEYIGSTVALQALLDLTLQPATD